MKLGRKPSTPDRRTLRLENYLDSSRLPAAPLSRVWSTKGGSALPVSMFANDELGDCTCAGIGHHDQIVAAWCGETSTLTTRDIVQLYGGSGYSTPDPDHPRTNDTDQGWTNVDAAKAAIEAGIIEGFASFDESNCELLATVINEFVGAYIAIELPMSAQDQIGKVWDVGPRGSTGGKYKRGGWGGHALIAVDADHEGLTVETWGARQRMTWPFWLTYGDEAIALLNKRLGRGGLSPAGFDVDQLRADIARVRAGRRP